MVPAVPIDGRAAPLPVRREQLRQDALRGGRIARPLEREANEVHAQQAGVRDRVPREQRGVADRDAGLVDAVLEAPQPPRTAAQHREGLPCLRDLHVLAPHGRPGLVRPAATSHNGWHSRPGRSLFFAKIVRGRAAVPTCATTTSHPIAVPPIVVVRRRGRRCAAPQAPSQVFFRKIRRPVNDCV